MIFSVFKMTFNVEELTEVLYLPLNYEEDYIDQHMFMYRLIHELSHLSLNLKIKKTLIPQGLKWRDEYDSYKLSLCYITLSLSLESRWRDDSNLYYVFGKENFIYKPTIEYFKKAAKQNEAVLISDTVKEVVIDNLVKFKTEYCTYFFPKENKGEAFDYIFN